MSPRSNLIRIRTTATASVPVERFDGLIRPGPREFPYASTPPDLPAIRDELLDLYAFIFCQHGFHELGMTFEQFLLAAITLRPGELEVS